MMRRTIPFAVSTLAIMVLLAAQTGVDQIAEALRGKGLELIDLRNDGYSIAFPPSNNSWVRYPGVDVEYIYSTIAPDGLSLFAMKREFGPVGLPRDTVLRRTLHDDVGPEELVLTPFANVFRWGVSQDERLMIIAGRLKDRGPGDPKRDGLFLLRRATGEAEYVAPWEKGGLNSSVRSLNVSNRGELVVYEDGGTIVTLRRLNGAFKADMRHPGQLPALMADGNAYVFAQHGSIVWSDGRTSKDILPARNVMGGIRPSPGGDFIAFGTSSDEHKAAPHLDVCEVASKTCVAGPNYDDWVPGRETYWVKR